MSRDAPKARGRARALLEIDLDAVVANWRILRDHARPAELAAVVKADAYGLGAEPVARALWEDGCRRLFVARLEEGLALRRLLPEAEILVLDGVGRGETEAFLAGRLVPVLNHPGELALWRQVAARVARRLPCALHVDTGMTRLGFTAAELEAAVADGMAELRPVLVMSHLACADEPDHPLNALQLERFRALARLLPEVPRSLAASSGIFLGRAYRFDLCRPGVALYGVNPTPREPNPMRPVVRLTAPILRVFTLREAATVGYGATYRAPAGARIATVPVGYADGLLRSLSGRGVARIAGIPVPYAGRVSMDLIGLDVSRVPEHLLAPGAEVELIGGPDGLDELARLAGTIAYELLTRLGRRFCRRYRRNGTGRP